MTNEMIISIIIIVILGIRNILLMIDTFDIFKHREIFVLHDNMENVDELYSKILDYSFYNKSQKYDLVYKNNKKNIILKFNRLSIKDYYQTVLQIYMSHIVVLHLPDLVIHINM